MPIYPTHETRKISWSYWASCLGLPEDIKLSVAKCVGEHKTNEKTLESSGLTIHDAWQCTSKYALRKVKNKSQDSDLLAQCSAERAKLKVPGLELLKDFPYGRLSEPVVEEKALSVLRKSAESLLLETSKISCVERQMSERAIVRLHDANCTVESERLAKELTSLQEGAADQMVLTLSRYLEKYQMAPQFHDRRECLREKDAFT